MSWMKVPLCPDGTLDVRGLFGATRDLRTPAQRGWYEKAVARGRRQAARILARKPVRP